MSSRPFTPMAMASSNWSTLPEDMLRKISKILNTDVDTLRIRSVCSSWRSALPPPLRPSCFPIELPPLVRVSDSRPRYHYFLNFSTLYRLSPPQIGPRAGDPSDGWLFRALEVSPNRFSLSSPHGLVTANYSPDTIPKFLNLLEYRITEICKCYVITILSEDMSFKDSLVSEKGSVNIAVLWNDYDFVVFLFLKWKNTAFFWKYGDKEWTPVDLMGHEISDVNVSNGKCYAISNQGILLSFDSSLKLKVIPMSPPIHGSRGLCKIVLEYKSDFYVVLKKIEEINSNEDQDIINRPFSFDVYKKCNNNWKHMSCLRDEFFLCSDDVSIGLAAENFRSGKANCIYVEMTNDPGFLGFKRRYGVCDLAYQRHTVMKMLKAPVFMNSPPSWLVLD